MAPTWHRHGSSDRLEDLGVAVHPTQERLNFWVSDTQCPPNGAAHDLITLARTPPVPGGSAGIDVEALGRAKCWAPERVTSVGDVAVGDKVPGRVTHLHHRLSWSMVYAILGALVMVAISVYALCGVSSSSGTTAKQQGVLPGAEG